MRNVFRMDPINKALKLVVDSGLLSRSLKAVLQHGKPCEVCGAPRAKAAVEWLLDSSRPLCDHCREFALGLVPEVIQGAARRAFINTLKGALLFGRGKPFLPGAPRLVTWELTSRCNTGRCTHCYTDSGHSRHVGELSTREAMDAVETFARTGVLGIAFTGGEALLREDFFEVASYAVSRGLGCYVATNGAMLSQETVHRIKEAGLCLVHVSLDSADPSVHDAFRGTPGLHRKAVEGIKRCVDAGLQVCISATATRSNIEGIPDLVDLADELGADWLLVYNFVPTGRGSIFLEPSAEERDRLFHELIERNRSSRRVRVNAFAPQFGLLGRTAGLDGLLATHYLDPMLAETCQGLVKASAGCLAGKYFLAMEPNGDLKPCTFLPVKVGNILTDDLDEVWTANPVLRDLRDSSLLHGHCSFCDSRDDCGGCRARAFAHTGDYLGSDPGCSRHKHSVAHTAGQVDMVNA